MGVVRQRPEWTVDDDTAMAMVPGTGFIHDYMQYIRDANDAPAWYHLGSILTAVTAAAGRRDLRVVRKDGKSKPVPLHMWSALIGDSGDRKSAAMNPVRRLLHRVNPSILLATDGSLEAWHDRLGDKDTDGVGIMHREELAHLFDQAKRSYSSSMVSWLNTCYSGGPISRETKSGGLVSVPRLRLSILGGIPPDTLQQKTTRADWRSGFIPRFTLWGAKRSSFVELDAEDEDAEEELGSWLRDICWDQDSMIILPQKPASIITDWIRTEIEEKREKYPPDIFSCFTRLQGRGFRIAAAFALADLSHLDNKPVQVRRYHAESALVVLKSLRKSTSGLFNLVGSDLASSEERRVLDAIQRSRGVDLEELVEICGLSRYRIQRILLSYMDEGLIFTQEIPIKKRGRCRKCYFMR